MANQYLQPFFDQLSQGTQVANQIRAAAQQQSQFEAEKQQREAEMKLREKDLQMREQQYQHGQDRQDLLDKLNMLQLGGHPVNKQGGVDQQTALPSTGVPGSQPGTETTSIPADPGRTLSIGGQGYQIPTLDDQAKTELARRVQQASALDEEKLGKYGVPLPDALAKEFQVKPGTKFLPEHATGLAKLHEAMQPEKPDKGKDPKQQLVTDDHGNMSFVAMGDDGKPSVTPVPGVKGKSRESMRIDLAGAATKPASKAQLVGIESKKSAALLKAEAQFRKEMGGAKIAGYTDPEAAQNALDTLNSAKQEAQNGYEAELRAAGVDPRHVEYAPQGKAPAPAQSGPKQLTNPTIAKQYLTKAGGDKDKARQLAKADGWSL